MNWKQTLNPWGYARGLEIALGAEKKAVVKRDDDLKQARITIDATGGKLNIERRNGDDLRIKLTLARSTNDDLKNQLSALKTELATALAALRIADERADKNAVACDAAHDRLSKNLPPAAFDNLLDDGSPTFKADLVRSKVGAIPKDKRRTKAKTADKRTATAPGGARLVLKNVEHDNRDSEKAYADAVKESKND